MRIPKKHIQSFYWCFDCTQFNYFLTERWDQYKRSFDPTEIAENSKSTAFINLKELSENIRGPVEDLLKENWPQ